MTPQVGDVVFVKYDDGMPNYGIASSHIKEMVNTNPHKIVIVEHKRIPQTYRGNLVVWTCFLDGNMFYWPNYMIDIWKHREPDWEV